MLHATTALSSGPPHDPLLLHAHSPPHNHLASLHPHPPHEHPSLSWSQLGSTAAAPCLELLKVFAYGTWSDYERSAASLPPLSEVQALKLKKLTVVSLALRSKTVSYETLMKEISAASVRQVGHTPYSRPHTSERWRGSLSRNPVRQVEDVLIECIYSNLLSGRLDQEARQLDVFACSGRDLSPSDLAQMGDTLDAWHSESVQLMSSLSSQLGAFKERTEAAKAEQIELDAKVEAVNN